MDSSVWFCKNPAPTEIGEQHTNACLGKTTEGVLLWYGSSAPGISADVLPAKTENQIRKRS